MRRASVVLSLAVLLLGGASTALAPAALASGQPPPCDIVGNVLPPAGDDCWSVMHFVSETYDRQAENVFWVFCEVFPDHSACV